MDCKEKRNKNLCFLNNARQDTWRNLVGTLSMHPLSTDFFFFVREEDLA